MILYTHQVLLTSCAIVREIATNKQGAIVGPRTIGKHLLTRFGQFSMHCWLPWVYQSLHSVTQTNIMRLPLIACHKI